MESRKFLISSRKVAWHRIFNDLKSSFNGEEYYDNALLARQLFNEENWMENENLYMRRIINDNFIITDYFIILYLGIERRKFMRWVYKNEWERHITHTCLLYGANNEQIRYSARENNGFTAEFEMVHLTDYMDCRQEWHDVFTNDTLDNIQMNAINSFPIIPEDWML